MPDHGRPDRVGDELVPLAVPREEHRARAAAAIDLRDGVARVRLQLHFILHDAGRPQQAHDVGLCGFADAGEDFGGALTEEAGGADGLELLPHRARLHLDLRADAAAVVVQTEQRDAHGVVGVAAVIAQADDRPRAARDQQVRVVVAIEIGRDETARAPGPGDAPVPTPTAADASSKRPCDIPEHLTAVAFGAAKPVAARSIQPSLS